VKKGGAEMESRIPFLLTTLIFFGIFLISGEALAKSSPRADRAIDPIVSTDWLEKSLGEINLIILDIRSPDDYGTGHIPGSINEPFATGFTPSTGPTSKWIVGSADGLWLELPLATDLFKTIGDLGISKASRVVIVTAPNPGEPPFYGLANGTRVAFTLIYAGVKNVAVLDGGYPKWAAEGKRADTKGTPPVETIPYKGKAGKSALASREYVKSQVKKAGILDARDADVYFGVTIEPFANKPGHIPSAKSLPAPWIWDLKATKAGGKASSYYTYKGTETLGSMASGVLGHASGSRGPKNQEIIVYCGVGGYASSWWFVLTQVLGYSNVKLYDGAAQEWAKHYEMVPYQWD
jgi:thiosulfate/3-mercaptopyruvate sulfurtransferase